MKYPTVFIDRDGVINRLRGDYVKSWAEFEFLPGSIDAIARLTASGRDVIVLSNQSAIAQGLTTNDHVAEIHARLASVVASHRGRISAFLICPHGRNDGCICRKPAPGLFFRAREELGVDLSRAVMIGDQPSDVEAALTAGCDAILIDPDSKPTTSTGFALVASLEQAVDTICSASS